MSWDREHACETAGKTAADDNRGVTSKRHTPHGGPCEGPGCIWCSDGYGIAGWDHGVWTALAITLAQPLRDALDRHFDEHLCGTGDHRSPHYIGGFGNCPTAMQLFELLPDGDRILLG